MKKHFFCLAVFFCAVFAWAEEEIHARLMAVTGRAEVRKAGQDKWKFAITGEKLSDNDMLRTYEGGRAEVKYSEGSVLVVRENTQILFNASTPERRRISKYVTAFFGAIYFVVQEALPKAYVNKVYTPTTVITIRGTSFAVQVDPQSALTDVWVTQGTVLVSNILLPQEYFFKGGTKTQVALNALPSPARALAPEEIRSLGQWAGNSLIQAECKKDERRKREERSRITGKTENKIVVLPLVDLSETVGAMTGKEFSSLIGREMRKATRSDVVCSDDTSADYDEVGRATRARLVLGGEIETFDLKREFAINRAANKYSEYSKAVIGFSIYVVDPIQNMLVKKIRIKEEARDIAKPTEVLAAMAQRPWNLDQADFQKSVLGQALQKAVAKLVEEARPYL